MANGTLQSLFREPRDRRTDRAVFAQAVSRISVVRSQKKEDARKPVEGRPKEA
ncbi:MAG: hypothetical protein M1133_15750 [Armatimonadetes bacterium]|nr:hypothetical protein [Armatimonadota bacterium]